MEQTFYVHFWKWFVMDGFIFSDLGSEKIHGSNRLLFTKGKDYCLPEQKYATTTLYSAVILIIITGIYKAQIT